MRMSLQELTPPGGLRRLPKEITDEIERSVTGPYLALMVYGSQARGSADEGSDVDVLAVVDRHAGAYSVGRVAVTAYTPAHLHTMAQSSSLFILHLRSEGVVLDDADGVLARALSAYVPLEDPASHWQALKAAASVVRVSDEVFSAHGQSIARLGLYVLRTALYLEAAENGRPHFDIASAAASTGDEIVLRACELRRQHEFSATDLRIISDAVHIALAVDPGRAVDSVDDLQKRAVELSTVSPHASALLVNVLFGSEDVDYVGLATAPW